MYIGHKREDGEEQPLAEHLRGVAKTAGEFAADFGAGAHAARTGLYHDIGKYGAKQQKRMHDPEHTAKIDHSTAGAQAVFSLGDLCGAFAAAGHHGGLMNKGEKFSSDDGTLMARMKKKIDADYLAYREEIPELSGDNKPLLPAWAGKTAFGAQFYTRMLFSCLVDADFLDTEYFMQHGQVERGDQTDMETLHRKFDDYITKKEYLKALNQPDESLNKKRSRVLERCLQGGKDAQGLYTLTVPTGGGKTLSSLAFALAHAKAYDLKRVIYVVPYTSIIEQTADVFSKVLGAEHVLEHHSQVEYKEDAQDSEDALQKKLRLATENWDMPVVVTTAVQFFESLFAKKTSRCRKLHSLARSVIVFDEAQMMPLPYLRPCVAAIAELVKHYKVTAVLCTATQPAPEKLFAEFSLQSTEIVPNAAQLYEDFRRVTYVREGQMAEDALCTRLNSENQALCIVNTRKTAQRIYAGLDGEGRFHLSTLMTPQDRRRTLMVIRQRLDDKLPCRVVSTSLIEAGVDVDFASVWREMAGLDSILQAGGRCNRENGNSKEESLVHVFSLPGNDLRMIRQQISAAKKVLEEYEVMDSPEAIHAYFAGLLLYKGEGIDQKQIMKLLENLNFETVAKEFKLIENDTRTVYIPCEENREALAALKAGAYSKALLRKLSQYSVQVYPEPYRDYLMAQGKLYEVEPDESAILADETAYTTEMGLQIKEEIGEGLFI